MQKKLFAGITALTLAALIIPSSFAFSGFGQREGGQNGGQNFNPENREAVEAALEAEDYSAFVEATGNSNLTEEKFEKMLERHSEMETRRVEMETERAAIEAAIADGDYETWKSLIEEKNPDCPLLEKITADNFSQLQEMQTLQKRMSTIHENLGIDGGFGKGFGGDRGGIRGRHQN